MHSLYLLWCKCFVLNALNHILQDLIGFDTYYKNYSQWKYLGLKDDLNIIFYHFKAFVQRRIWSCMFKWFKASSLNSITQEFPCCH